jgi:hypothetical protein
VWGIKKDSVKNVDMKTPCASMYASLDFFFDNGPITTQQRRRNDGPAAKLHARLNRRCHLAVSDTSYRMGYGPCSFRNLTVNVIVYSGIGLGCLGNRFDALCSADHGTNCIVHRVVNTNAYTGQNSTTQERRIGILADFDWNTTNVGMHL